MKRKLLSFLTVSLLAGMSLPAANIAWVSLHSADNTPNGNATNAGFTNAPDAGYTRLLAANGHTVTRFVTVADIQNQPDLITAFNTNDLVIISRSVPSGHYDIAEETAAWNTSVTVPLMSINGYVNRNNRLGFNTGDTIPDVNSNPMRLRVLYRAHPIFAGVALNDTNLMVNPFSSIQTHTNATTGATQVQRGASVVTSAPIGAMSILARVGTPGDAAFNGMVIGEIAQGVSSSHGRDVFAAKRLVFITGSRELNITGDAAGMYDLEPDGAQMFLNAVTYLTTPQPPLPPECTTPLVGGVNLPEGAPWTFNAGVVGDLPRTYQWYKDGQPLPTATEETLVFTALTLADAGAYQLFVTNAGGFASSTIASLAFATVPPASITNGLIAYWPLNEVQGTKTFDLVSTYDMNLVNMGPGDVVPGKWGNAFQFNGTNALLERINNPGDALPIYNHPDFSVSLWVNGLVQGEVGKSDRRVFSEGSLTSGNPLFNLGTHNTGADGTLDIFIRNDGGTANPNHAHSAASAFDGNWRHITYVQRDIGDGNMNAQVWIDGALDSVVLTPIRPLTVQATAIGAVRRAAASAWYSGLIDEVAVWDRALSAEEIQILQVTSITNPPVRLIPLAISRSKSDVPAVVAGGSTTLRWEVSRDVTQVTVNGVDMTASTLFGSGSLPVTLNASTNYVLTISRGGDTLSATTSVAVVDGVSPAAWALLDNFDQTPLGILAANGYWNEATPNAAQVVDTNANHALRTATAGSVSFLNLQDLSVNENQARTLFFRLIPGADTAAGITNIVGLTDKSQRSYGDAYQNIGPVLYVAAFTNELAGVVTNGWYIGARNGFTPFVGSNPIDYLAEPLEAGAVYNVWIDVTNAPLAQYSQDLTTVDVFTVYIQKLGDPTRTVAFQDYRSDRDPESIDVVLGGVSPSLDQLVVLGNNATHSALFDDFYLSSTTYNATVPRPYEFTGVLPGLLTISVSGAQLEIGWTAGILQHAPSVTGPWEDVPGNPTSPILVAPSGDAMFYRTRQ
ncbi:MAG: hypothetical protein IH623_23125 [Verrucomicrobia bacterium]|nr:hypothetical protein [Verrucomicrobiota bacterium]